MVVWDIWASFEPIETPDAIDSKSDAVFFFFRLPRCVLEDLGPVYALNWVVLKEAERSGESTSGWMTIETALLPIFCLFFTSWICCRGTKAG